MTPILRQNGILIASIQMELSDGDILALQSRILQDVISVNAKAVIIDVSALDVMDSFGTRTLNEIAGSVELCGARTIIVGIQPEVAMAMVLLGLDFRNIATAFDLDHAFDLLKAA